MGICFGGINQNDPNNSDLRKSLLNDDEVLVGSPQSAEQLKDVQINLFNSFDSLSLSAVIYYCGSSHHSCFSGGEKEGSTEARLALCQQALSPRGACWHREGTKKASHQT